MTSNAKTIHEYLDALPEDRKVPIQAVRDVIVKNLNEGFQECIQYGMIGYSVPHSLFPAGYHCDPKQPLPFAHLASQKNYMSLYLMCTYGNSDLREWFVSEYQKTGKKLDMGKSCIRFKKLDDLPLDLIGELISKVTVEKFVDSYLQALASTKKK